MSPLAGRAGRKPRGSGPEGAITPEDIRAKAEQLTGDVQGQVRAKRSLLAYAAVASALAALVAAFVLGRRSGRRRSTVVEIRRG
jgi:hypothetical protein